MWAAGYQAEKVKSYFKRKYCWFYDLGFLTASELHNESLRNPTKQILNEVKCFIPKPLIIEELIRNVNKELRKILNEGHAEYGSEDQSYLQNLSAIYKLSLRIRNSFSNKIYIMAT